MALARGRGTALWKQIEIALEQEILRGEFKPGERLPTEAVLSDRFRVNRHTIRRALSVLEQKELIRIEQGRGSFVLDSIISYPVTRRTRFSENLIRGKRSPRAKLLRQLIIPADTDVSQALYIPVGTQVISLELLREADGLPISFSVHCFPLPRFQGIGDIVAETESITAALKQFGVEDYLRKTTWIMARLPTQEEMSILRQPRARPILDVKSVNIDPRGVPVDFGHARYAGDRVQIVFEP